MTIRSFVVIHGDIYSDIFRNKWFYLFGTAFLLFSAWRGLSTGSTTTLYRTVKQSEHKYLYWWGIGLSVIGGICCLIAFAYLVQHEP
jgi:hypothetical protein